MIGQENLNELQISMYDRKKHKQISISKATTPGIIGNQMMKKTTSVSPPGCSFGNQTEGEPDHGYHNTPIIRSFNTATNGPSSER